MKQSVEELVNHPRHYCNHPSGVEAIVVCRLLNFNLGNVFKYVFRRNDKEGERSLKSAMWYLDDHRLMGDNKHYKQAFEWVAKIAEHEPDVVAKQFYREFGIYIHHPTVGKMARLRGKLFQLIVRSEGKREPE